MPDSGQDRDIFATSPTGYGGTQNPDYFNQLPTPSVATTGVSTAGQAAGAGQPAASPFTQLVNMLLRSQLQEALGKYFYPGAAMPGAGSVFTPGQTTPPAAGAGPGGATTPGLPSPMSYLPGATGQAAPAPSGGFTPGGLPSPVQGFSPPSQSPLPTPTAYGQGPAGINQGWQQFLGGLGIQGLPTPSMAGGGSLLVGS